MYESVPVAVIPERLQAFAMIGGRFLFINCAFRGTIYRVFISTLLISLVNIGSELQYNS